jgi:hypothetical protein
MEILSNRKKQLFYFLLLGCFVLGSSSFEQDPKSLKQYPKVSKLFSNQEVLSLKLSYSNKEVRQKTNDSTYITTELSYQEEGGSWKTFEVAIRARGNFRRNNCNFTPLKIKITKSISKGTLFVGNKKLKLVMPCLDCKNGNDDILKEYMAYKMYEVISPYHFKTRLVKIDFAEIKGKKVTNNEPFGILIEDLKKVAHRYDGHELKRLTHPLAQDATNSVRNTFFQFMIANTDFSTVYQHNQKLLFVDKKAIPVPYDFDLSGFVNADYAFVSNASRDMFGITKVTQRIYRGFQRDEEVFEQVREEFLRNKMQINDIMTYYKPFFRDLKTFFIAKDFISSFYQIISDDLKYRTNIVSMSRTK